MNRKMPIYLVVCLSILWLMVACHNSDGGIPPTQNTVGLTESTATVAAATMNTEERNLQLALVKLERNPLATKPCSPPCWQGITPGITSMEEARKILFGEMDPDRVCPYPEGNVWEANALLCEELFWIQGEADKQRKIDYMFLWPTVRVTLAQALERYGEPRKLYIGWTGLPDAPPNGVAISIPYPEHGFCLIFERDEEIYVVEPDLVVHEMLYYSPGEVALGCFGSVTAREKPWIGYGDYYPYDDK